eukprot:TRINITY_DN27899_c0_g1_i2.p1 TRINITY_DN27899_c0_g1~~TRINITY_DN27899_c0_g1_i2.p1  ORF type:complete len:362 (+),score=141.89 TRINITY_DN27899_c0_g1_i2:133-1218(+)
MCIRDREVGDAAVEEEAFDPLDCVEAVDVLAKLPKDWFETCASASKWTEKKEQIDAVAQLADVPKIEHGDYLELVKVLDKFVTDGNINVATAALQAVTKLAAGLKIGFLPYVKVVLQHILDRFKEKKSTAIAAVNGACDAMILPSTLTEAHEILEACWKHKVAQVRAGALAWTSRLVLKTPKNNILKIAKPIAAAMSAPLADKDPAVRTAAVAVFGALVANLGDKPFNEILFKMDSKIKSKVEEFAAANKTAAPAPAPAAAPPANSTASTTPKKGEVMSFEPDPSGKPKRSPPARFAKKAEPMSFDMTDEQPASPPKGEAMTFDMDDDKPKKRSPPARFQQQNNTQATDCLLYTSPSPRDS